MACPSFEYCSHRLALFHSDDRIHQRNASSRFRGTWIYIEGWPREQLQDIFKSPSHVVLLWLREPVKWSIDIRQRRTATLEHAVRGQIDSPRTPLAVDWRFRKCLKRTTRCSFRTPGRRRPCRRRRRCHIAQFARRISTCAKCRAPRKDVATRSSRAPILARAGAHGAAQAPFAGYLTLGSKRLRRLAGRRP